MIRFSLNQEKAKNHNPFTSFNIVTKYNQESNKKKERFHPEWEVEKILKLKKGVLNKLSNNFLVDYKVKGKQGKRVYDIGLNLKNNYKKLHIPKHVNYALKLDVVNNPKAGQSESEGDFKVIYKREFEYSSECL